MALNGKNGNGFEEAKKKRESAQTTAQLDKEELQNIEAKADIELQGQKAGIVAKIQGLHDEYNKAFHTSANDWIGKKFS